MNKNTIIGIIVVIIIALGVWYFMGRDEEPTMNDMMDTMEESADDMQDSMEDMSDDMQDSMDDMTDDN